jgi:hypothetical protein
LFDFSKRTAGLASIVWLLGTTVLPYAQVHQQNNQILLFVTLGYACALAYVLRGRPYFALLSGLALGAAFLIRTSSSIHAFTVLLFLVGCIAYQSRDKLQVLRGMGLWLIGLTPLVLVGRIIDYIRYGSFWTTGQQLAILQQQMTTNPIWSNLPEQPANYPFSNPPHVGILGVLFSPAKSIFIYDPLLLPCLILGIFLWKKLSPYIKWYLITGVLNLGLHIVLTSRLVFWSGDSAWGARYHVTSVQLLLIPLIALFIHYLLSLKGWRTWLMRGILLLAIMVQIAAVIMPYNLEVAQAKYNYNQFYLGLRVRNILCLANPSFSDQCVSQVVLGNQISLAEKQALEYDNRVHFLPFGFSRKVAGNSFLSKLSPILFGLWGLLLTLAITTTFRFVYSRS